MKGRQFSHRMLFVAVAVADVAIGAALWGAEPSRQAVRPAEPAD